MKRLVKVGAILTVMALTLSSCNCYNKMTKAIDDVKASANPELLSLKGSTVNTDVTVNFPAKYFHKKAVMRVTPVLVFDEGEIAGTPKYLQGEKVKDNYTVISRSFGGSYTQAVTFPYDPRADLSTMELRIEVKCKSGDFVRIATIPVAQGISTVQNSADWTAYLSIMPDNFKRVTTVSESADLMYLINSAQVRPTALNAEDIKLLEDFVRTQKEAERTELEGVQAKGYASPDGPVKFNDELSRNRSNTGKEAISKKLSDVNTTFDAAAYGEDWDGFKKLVEESNIPDKNLILQVLSMHSSSVQRDQEIHNMSQVFEVLKRDILPQLRRTQLVATANVTGKTDEELVAATKSNINSLSLEEMLFAATLVDDNADKARIYKAAADQYNDPRAYNNYGVALAKQGNYEDAKRQFERAAGMQSAPEISNNLGAIALAQGNIDEAKRYLSALNSTDAQANKALVALAEGDYSTAVRGLKGYNLAVAELCNGNLSAAKTALGNYNCPCADYLRAQIAMREGDSTGAIANLRNASSKCDKVKARAARDAEFRRLHGTPEFDAI
ncbi:MAG: tetratricopeptide repeat protein [Rikenellaceae bacterium]|nr:tetratricopeptide repeat protein [Rikenellaceae bacterium]